MTRAQAEAGPAGSLVETVHTVETPEGVALALRLAGVVPRALAFALDASLRMAFYAFAAIPLTIYLERVGFAVWFLVIALGEIIYPVTFELLADGQTIGKRNVGIRVVHGDGTRIGWQASLVRNLLTAADGLPGTYLFALVSMLCSRRFQRIGDHVAGTVVVYVEEKMRAVVPRADVEPAAPAVALSLDERAAVLAFAARADELTPARCEELASLASPLVTPGGGPASQQIEAVAAYLRGTPGSR